MDREYKSFPTFVKSIGDNTFKQVFSVFGVVDLYKDKIKKGSFTKTLKERMDKVKVLWQHDFFMPPVAALIDAYEIDAGDLPDEVREKYPEATGALEGVVEYLNTPRGEEIVEGISKGAITENSIGFDAIKINWVEESVNDDIKIKIREITEIRLWDLSPVNWGANPATFNRNQKMFNEIMNRLSGIELTEQGDMPPFEVIQLSRALDDMLGAPYVKELEWFDELKALNDALLIEAEPEDVENIHTHFGLMQSKICALSMLVESYGG